MENFDFQESTGEIQFLHEIKHDKANLSELDGMNEL